MIQTTINLSRKRKLHLRIVKRRGASEEKPLLPNMGEVMRIRRGSKFSRFFKHIFEHKNFKRIFGANMALAIVASTIFPTQNAFANGADENIISAEIVQLTTEKGVQYPVENVSVTQGYKFFHPAIDFDGLTGDVIYPIMAGTVGAVAYSNYAYGNAILIDHGSGLTSLYAHLSKINVAQGQKVNVNTIIGLMGATGRAYGDHLHLEIRDNGRPLNPYSILPVQ